MNQRTFLTFSLNGVLLAVDAKVVREIGWLPELTLIEECPSFIAGVVNMHGKVVPVMDLSIRFGHAPQRYRCSDRLITLDSAADGMGSAEIRSELRTMDPDRKLLGIIANDVHDVIDIPEEDIEAPPFEGKERALHPHFVSGEAKAGEKIIMILNHRAIPDPDFEIKGPELEEAKVDSPGYFCREADPGEKELFHDRAADLRKMSDNEDAVRSLSVAVVSLNGEYLCVELDSVREFSKIHNFTPVPCCPGHIAGNMNLRGNVLTVIDIRGALNMRPGRITEATKVVIADTGEFPVGIIVDEIEDVVNIREKDIVPIPSSLRAIHEKFVKGAAPYNGRMAVLLDLEKILSWDGLIVNEEV